MSQFEPPFVAGLSTIDYSGPVTVSGLTIVDVFDSSVTVTISALDAGFPASLQGTLFLNAPNVVGNNTGQISITGSPADITAELAGLVYTPPAGALVTPFSPDLVEANLIVSVTNGSVTAYADGNLISAPWISWVLSENPNLYTPDSPGRETSPPTITVPSTVFTTPEQQDLAVSGLSVGNSDWVQTVIIRAGNGVLDMPAGSGFSIHGNGTNQLTITGTTSKSYLVNGSQVSTNVIPLGSLNAALGGLSYTSNSGFAGLDTLYFNALSPDFGATGSETVGIRVTPPLPHPGTADYTRANILNWAFGQSWAKGDNPTADPRKFLEDAQTSIKGTARNIDSAGAAPRDAEYYVIGVLGGLGGLSSVPQTAQVLLSVPYDDAKAAALLADSIYWQGPLFENKLYNILVRVGLAEQGKAMSAPGGWSSAWLGFLQGLTNTWLDSLAGIGADPTLYELSATSGTAQIVLDGITYQIDSGPTLPSLNGNLFVYDTLNNRGLDLTGSAGNDVVIITASGQIIRAGNGNNIISVYGGNNTIFAGSGNEVITGGRNDTIVSGGGGQNTFDGGSGWDDQVVYSVASSQAVLTQNGDGSWTVSIPSEGETDKLINVAAALFTDQTISLRPPLPSSAGNVDEWILSNGSWAASAGPGPIPSGFQGAGIGDFTGSGTDGILWYNSSSGDVSEWKIFFGAWNGSVDLGTHPGNFSISGVGDFNGDGIDDVLWTNASGGGVQTDVWELVDGQWAASVSPGTHPAGYQVAGVGEFAGNGTAGILWHNASTGDTDEWQLANGHWAASVDLGAHPGSGWQIAGVGHFFGNSVDGVLWTSVSGNGQIQTDIWELGSNGQWVASVSPGTHPGGYQVVAVGDFTGNGTSDILWQNPTTGDVDEWLINNGQWAGSVDLGAHPGNYQLTGIGDFTGDGIKGVLWHSPS